MTLLTDEEIRATVADRYEYRDGGLWAKKAFNSRVKVGQRAGVELSDGYRQVRLYGKQYREHHLVWLLHKGYFPKELDHINCVRDDNSIENLRECSRIENMHHRILATKRSITGVLGATKVHGRYAACIQRDGVRKHLGTFDTANEAGAAYASSKSRYEREGVL